MELVIPVGGFMFVLGLLAAENQIRRGGDWIGPGLIAALGFAAMVWTWAMISAG